MHPELSESVAALFSEEVLIAVAIDVARTINPLSCSGSNFSPVNCRFNSRRILTAVSYTHLDVYKRQDDEYAGVGLFEE